MTTRYLIKVFCREFAIYYRLAITTNNINKLLYNNLNKCRLKDTYFVIYGIISEFTDKGNFTSLPGQFQYLTLLRGLQGGLTCKFDQGLSTAKNLSIGCYFA